MRKGLKAAVVTDSTSYEPRAEYVGACLSSLGCQVAWVESDFNHREKKKTIRTKADHVYVNTVPYKKNLSLRRFYYHWDFARKAGKCLGRTEWDLLYVLIPGNSLARMAALLKGTAARRVVLDVIDLWPESLPVKGLEWTWPVKAWRQLRDKNLNCADLILTECGLYQKILRLPQEKTAVMYWPKDGHAVRTDFQKDADILHIAYLGSVNHIIDIEGISELLGCINQRKTVLLHLIGSGESLDKFQTVLKDKGIAVRFYGAVYEEEAKREIFSRCSFGINMMKPEVRVGITMKSVDYFCYGLPLINSIPGDTWELVERYGIGVNCRRERLLEAAEQIVGEADLFQEKRDQIRELYERLFTREAMEAVMRKRVLPLLETD